MAYFIGGETIFRGKSCLFTIPSLSVQQMKSSSILFLVIFIKHAVGHRRHPGV
jgi:hypothetical protein